MARDTLETRENDNFNIKHNPKLKRMKEDGNLDKIVNK